VIRDHFPTCLRFQRRDCWTAPQSLNAASIPTVDDIYAITRQVWGFGRLDTVLHDAVRPLGKAKIRAYTALEEGE